MNVHTMFKRIFLHLKQGFITAPLTTVRVKLYLSPSCFDIICKIFADTLDKLEILIHVHNLVVNAGRKVCAQWLRQIGNKFITVIINALILIQIQRTENASYTCVLISLFGCHHFFTNLSKAVRVVAMQYNTNTRRYKTHPIIVTRLIVGDSRKLI